jgi:uncharacterized damage-inducible protein DinB
MPLLAHFRHMLAYDRWANARMLEALQAQDFFEGKAQYWLCHLLQAEGIWLDRLQTGRSPRDPHEVFPAPEALARLEALSQALLAELEMRGEEGLSERVAYANTRGEAFENTAADIFAHLINHSTHHRAQAAAALRAAGKVPPATDYIFFRR